MGSARQVRDWLSWLVRVRVLVITFLLGIELVIRQFVPSAVPIRYFLSLVLLWYTLSVFYAILHGLELNPYLQDAGGELEELQAFNENIILSMGGGLLTTDLVGRILLLNPAGEGILGLRLPAVRGARLADAVPELATLIPAKGKPGRARQEVRVRSDGEKEKVLGLNLSLLRTREGTESGFVYNFEDLTELKRLEAEVVQQERMA